ncbi:MAG: 2,4-dihydroxyhept-2-ene-1,7-dioic acid aldolase [Anaerolineaceae bacterium]|nr:2,4-dihydroxyhept-2-ene-1,7-dioic acid aldolase [Anaerolineaceae bacterium]
MGTRIHSHWPSIVEVLGHTGLFDYVEFLAEYAPFTLSDLDNICLAAELHNLGTMIKVDEVPRQYHAQRAIGAGFQSVLFADVRSAEDARQCIRIVKPETPEDGGLNGVATRRFAYMGYGGNPEYVQALRDVVIVLMIEKKPAVDHLDEILAVPGIDMVQWGGADYSMSVGKAGERRSPEIKAIERRVFETCLRAGIPPRVEIASPEEAAPYIDMGVRHFSLGSELNILFSWWQNNADALRKMIS